MPSELSRAAYLCHKPNRCEILFRSNRQKPSTRFSQFVRTESDHFAEGQLTYLGESVLLGENFPSAVLRLGSRRHESVVESYEREAGSPFASLLIYLSLATETSPTQDSERGIRTWATVQGLQLFVGATSPQSSVLIVSQTHIKALGRSV